MNDDMRTLDTNTPRVAIIGAGISGVVSAKALASQGWDVTVFEKSRGLGGRMSTRRVNDDLWFDHGAQYFTARDSKFQQMVEEWEQAGIVQRWEGRVAVIGRSQEIEWSDGTNRFVAVPGMNALCKHLAVGLAVKTETRVGRIAAKCDSWRLFDDQEESLGEFDGVIVTAPAGQTAELLRPVAPSLAKLAADCEMNPCWAVMVGFDQKLDVDFDGAFVHNSNLSWVARNNSKPGRNQWEAWVLHATTDWTRAHIGSDKDGIGGKLLEEFAIAIGRGLPKISYETAHFWRYAIPSDPLSNSCLYDSQLAIVASGDWCGGPRVEGAYLSGLAAAGQMMSHLNDTIR